MTVADELGYHVKPPNAVQRTLQALAASRAGARFFARVLPPVDTWTGRLTGHRHSAPGLLTGLPVVDVTTIGRKSGAPRTAHLIAIPYRDTLALIGTNFGQRSTPAWVLNLEANPAATLSYRGRTVPVVARLADEEEHEGVLAGSERLYIGYRKYHQRITGRRVRIFVLERPAG